MRTISKNGENISLVSPMEILTTLLPIVKQFEKFKEELIQFERLSTDEECDRLINPTNMEVNNFGMLFLNSELPDKFPIENLFGISSRIIWLIEAAKGYDPSLEILLVTKNARCFQSILEFALFGLTPGKDWKEIILYSSLFPDDALPLKN
jgi:hypothetical protein